MNNVGTLESDIAKMKKDLDAKEKELDVASTNTIYLYSYMKEGEHESSASAQFAIGKPRKRTPLKVWRLDLGENPTIELVS